MTQTEYGTISQSQDKTEQLLKLWIREKGSELTFSRLQIVLGAIDRYDVLDDISKYLGTMITALIFQIKVEKSNFVENSNFVEK